MTTNTADDNLIALPKVKEISGLGTTSIYKKMKDGTFPKQCKDGVISRWSEREVRAWVAAKLAARSLPPASNDDHHQQAA